MDTLTPPHSAESVAVTRSNVIAQAARYATVYLVGVDARSVAPTPEAVSGLAALRGDLPAESTSPEAVLEMLHTYGSPATVTNSGGRYFGFVNGGMVPAA